MQQHGPQGALAKARPAALVLELADHLQQFVGVVVDPAGTADGGAALRLARWRRHLWGGRLRRAGLGQAGWFAGWHYAERHSGAGTGLAGSIRVLSLHSLIPLDSGQTAASRAGYPDSTILPHPFPGRPARTMVFLNGRIGIDFSPGLNR